MAARNAFAWLALAAALALCAWSATPGRVGPEIDETGRPILRHPARGEHTLWGTEEVGGIVTDSTGRLD